MDVESPKEVRLGDQRPQILYGKDPKIDFH
jgi:hypothetical protein